ncbi:MAG: HAD family phosphatase [Kiritimatiellales bacterium]|nr:HAD family phosphatase [Pontiella sp.]NNJ70074.1 HAD family phosphatase [Kiritimatiellales bacterium]
MKYFLFDIGNVLVDFDFNVLCQTIADAAGRPEAVFTDHDIEIHNANEQGLISDAEWVDHLNASMGISWSVADLTATWSRIFTINEAGRGMFLDAAASGVPVYTLSNIAKHHVDAIENNWAGFFNGADGLFLSYQIGVRKPHPDIYRHALNELNASGEECFFIDDRSENVESALELGFHAHQFIPENHAAIREAAKAFFGW